MRPALVKAMTVVDGGIGALTKGKFERIQLMKAPCLIGYYPVPCVIAMAFCLSLAPNVKSISHNDLRVSKLSIKLYSLKPF